MNKKTLGTFLMVVGFAVAVLGVYTFVAPNTTQTETRPITASGTASFPLELQQGNRVQATLTVIEGNDGIEVYLENPFGEQVYTGGVVYSSLEFSYTSGSSGTYKLHLNNLSDTSSQIVELTLVYSAYSWIVSLVISLVGIALVVSGGVSFFVGTQKN
jgi:uncharacterized membrane protein